MEQTPHFQEMESYVSGVLDGSLISGSLVRAACLRHRSDMETAESRGFYFDEDSASEAISLINGFRHTTGEFAGQSFDLRPFQKFIIGSLFGWKKTADGFRRFHKAFISLGRGNGKTPLAAAIGNLMFALDHPPEPRAQVYSFATKEKQARICWEEAKEQIQKSESAGLRKLIVVQQSNMHIPSTGSKFEPLGSDSKTNSGWNIHCAIKDEIHEWGDHHRGLNATIDTAMAKRRQPLLITITTAGDDNSELWIEEYDWCSQVAMGNIQADDYFVYIAEVDRERECEECQGRGCQQCEATGRVDVDVFDEANWPMANPMLLAPRSPVKVEELRSFASKAKVVPSKEREFRRFHANQFVCSYTRLFSPELWAKGNKPIGKLEGRECFIGFDSGSRDDLTALAVVFPFPEEREYHVLLYAWITDQCPHDLQIDPWKTFIEREELTITRSGRTTSVDAIYDRMEQLISTYQVKSVAYDYNHSREFGDRCANKWGINIYGFPQTCGKYNEPIDGMIGALQDGQLHHGGNQLLAWAASNAIARTDSLDRKMPNKPRSKAKIDPLVALLMAFSESKFAECDHALSYQSGEMWN